MGCAGAARKAFEERVGLRVWRSVRRVSVPGTAAEASSIGVDSARIERSNGCRRPQNRLQIFGSVNRNANQQGLSEQRLGAGEPVPVFPVNWWPDDAKYMLGGVIKRRGDDKLTVRTKALMPLAVREELCGGWGDTGTSTRD